jgi:hypothetical protein
MKMADAPYYEDIRLQRDQILLEEIKKHLPALKDLLILMEDSYEDSIYRFYHQSYKVYSLQYCTVEAAELFKKIAQSIDGSLCNLFEGIVVQGTGVTFEGEHNENWPRHTRPIVEAFFHAKYFVEMMVKYGGQMESVSPVLPSGWAAILELYNQR